MALEHLSEEDLALLASEKPSGEVAMHLAHCADCRTRWEQYVALRQALRELPRPPLPRDFTFDLRAVAALHHQPWWWRYRMSIRVSTLLAATILVILLASFTRAPILTFTRGVEQARTPTPTTEEVQIFASGPTVAEPGAPGAGGESGSLPFSLAARPEDTTATPAEAMQPPVGRAENHETELTAWLVWSPFILLLAILLGLVTFLGLLFGFVLPFWYRQCGFPYRRS